MCIHVYMYISIYKFIVQYLYMYIIGVEITVDEAMEKMGFGPFQVLVTFFTGMLWVRV